MPSFPNAANLRIDSPLRGLETKFRSGGALVPAAFVERVRHATRETFRKLVQLAIAPSSGFDGPMRPSSKARTPWADIGAGEAVRSARASGPGTVEPATTGRTIAATGDSSARIESSVPGEDPSPYPRIDA